MHDMEKTNITQVIQKPSLKIRGKYSGVPQLRLFVHIYVESTQSVRPPDGSVIIRIPPYRYFPGNIQINALNKVDRQEKRSSPICPMHTTAQHT